MSISKRALLLVPVLLVLACATFAMAGNIVDYTYDADGNITDANTSTATSVNITANPMSIQSGGTSTLSWTSINADSCTIAPGIGTVNTSGSTTVSPTTTTTYTITATHGGSTATSSVRVTVTANPLPTVSLSANPSAIQQGGSATLTWTTTNATACTIDQGIGTVNTSGSTTVSPSATTTYTITATGTGGTATGSATVTVTANPPPTVTISANPASIQQGGSSTLTWSSTNATSCTIDQGIGTLNTSGSTTVSPTATTTYTITATGTGGTVTSSVTVTVSTTPPPTASISANPVSIPYGGSSTLTWSSTHADSCDIQPGIGAVSTSGSITVSPSATTTYTITAHGQGGTATSTVTVTVGAPPAPTVQISANPATIVKGSSTTLTWTSTNATSCDIQPVVGAVGPNWSISVSPAATTTYTITATGPGGTATSSVTVTVNPLPAPTVSISANPATIVAGASSTLSWTSTNATSCSIDHGIGTVNTGGSIQVSPTTTTTYTITATGAGGTVTSSVTVTVTAPPPVPTVQISANPTSIQSGGSSTLSWTSTNATSCSIDHGVGTVNTSGTASVTPTTSTTYTITATGAGGTATASTTITVTPPPPPQSLIIRPNAAGDETNIPYQTPSSGLHYDKVDEATPDENTTSVYLSVYSGSYFRDLYNLENSSLGGTINWVKVWIRASSPYMTSGTYAKTAIKTGGTVYEGSAITLTTSYANYYTQYATNPKTGVAWTWTDINNLQAGVSLRTDSGVVIYCTQVYVEVNYTPAPPVPTVSISADPSAIQTGGTSTLTWNSANATSCTIDHGIGNVPVTGSIAITTAATTTYTITATGAGGTVTAATIVTVTSQFSQILRPNAAGDETNITNTLPSGQVHYTMVDDPIDSPDDNDTRLYETASSYKRDLFSLEDSAVSGIINWIKVWMRARSGISSGDTAKTTIKTGGTVYEGSPIQASGSWTNYSTQYTTNPKTGVAWTWDDINSLQAGVSLKGGSWLTGWGYRKSITLSRPSGVVTGYQMKLLVGESAGASGAAVNCGGKGKTDFSDLRFTATDGATLLPYWIESISGSTPNQLATIWIKFDSIGTSATTFYVYYGNASASSASSGTNTFDLFDDFSGDLSLWNITGSVSIVSGICQITGSSAIDSKSQFGLGYSVRALSKAVTIGDYSMAVEWRNQPETEYARFINWSLLSSSYESADDPGGGTVTDVAQNTNYHVREVSRIASNSVKYYIDDVLKATRTRNSTSADRAGARASGKAVYVDWILVRKILDTGPAWGSWGAEEIGGLDSDCTQVYVEVNYTPSQ